MKIYAAERRVASDGASCPRCHSIRSRYISRNLKQCLDCHEWFEVQIGALFGLSIHRRLARHPVWRTAKEMSHVCFQDRLRYDMYEDCYRCLICGKRYHPKNRKPSMRDDWRPWEMPVVKMRFFRWETHWYPWRWYR